MTYTTEELLEALAHTKQFLQVVYEEMKPHITNAELIVEAVPQLDAISAIVRAQGEIVRCGNCKFKCDFTDGHSECRLYPPVPMSYRKVKVDDFCSEGERKDGEQDG